MCADKLHHFVTQIFNAKYAIKGFLVYSSVLLLRIGKYADASH